MWWNSLALILVMCSLIVNGIRLIRHRRLTNRIAFQPALMVVIMSILLVVLFTGVRWPLWFAGAGLLLLLTYRVLLKIFREISEAGHGEEAAAERIDAIEADRRAWDAAYQVSPVSRPVQASAVLESPRWFPTTTGKLLRIGPGELSATLSDWGTMADYEKSIILRMTLGDDAGNHWTTSYWLDVRSIAEIALSEEAQCEEVMAWTQIRADWETCFRQHMLLTGAQFYMDGRDYYPLRLGKDEYIIREKHLGGFIDLAWNAASSRFLARIRDVPYHTKNGLDNSHYSDEDSPHPTVWDPAWIEPFAFEVLPMVLMPFDYDELPYRLEPDPANENHMSIWGGRKYHFCFGPADPSHRLIAFAPVGATNQGVGLLERDTSDWLSQPEE